jgi:serine/threonine protein kinase
MMTSSPTPKRKSPVLEKGCRLLIKLGQCSESYRVIKELPLPQVGTSYKIKGSTINDSTGVVSSKQLADYFLKLPDVAPDDKSLGSRIQAEVDRGRELRQLIAESEQVVSDSETKQKTLRFNLPKLIASARIDSITPTTDDASQLIGSPAILYQWIRGDPLEVLGKRAHNSNPLTGVRERWFDFASGLVEMMRRVHNHGMLHGSIIPRNIIYASPNQFWLVGFGYSSLSFEAAAEGRSEKLSDRCYLAPETRSRGLGALWDTADIYSMGALLYDLAVGEFPSALTKKLADAEGRISTSRSADVSNLKKEVRTGLERAATNATESLKKVLQNDNVAKILDNCLRPDPADRFDTVEELAEAIELARTGPSSGKKTYFDYVAERREDELKRLRKRIHQGAAHDEIFRSRTIIIAGLCQLLNRLPAGAKYCTVTLPSYWTDKNLGPDGRFLAMNRHVAKGGVKIERLFLVSGGLSTLTDAEQEILRFQLAASKAVRNKKGGLTVKVLRVPEEVVRDFERSGRSVAFVATKRSYLNKLPKSHNSNLRNKFLSLNFISRGQESKRYGKFVIDREIRKVRIWDPARGPAFWNRFRDEAATFSRQWEHRAAVDVNTYLEARGKQTLSELLRLGNNGESGILS